MFKNGGIEYKGEFNNYKKEGKGNLYENGNVIYKGDVVNGKEEGNGIRFMKKRGEFYQGKFENGIIKEEHGKYYSSFGLVYQDINKIEYGEVSLDDIKNNPFNKTLTKEGLTFLESMKGKYSDFVNRLRLVIPRQFSKHVELKWGTLTKRKEMSS